LKPKYKKYKIKKGDTLASVSNILGKPTQEVKNFHNIFCDHENFIILDFPENFEELFIYPEYSEVDLNPIPKVFFDGGNKLLFRPISKKMNYGVQYTIKTGDKISTMKFDTSVYFKRKNQDGMCLFEIDRISKTFLNDEETANIAEELAEKVASVIYPLEIIVDNEGKWTDIYNYDQIQKRWENIKTSILENYEGEFVKKYLQISENTLENESALLFALSKDWFLNAFFGGIYINYSSKYSCNRAISFPILPFCEAPNYAVEQKIDEYLDNYKLISIEQAGNLNDDRAKLDFENNLDFPYYAMQEPPEEKAFGKFKARYFLNSTSHCIESMRLKSSIDLEIPKSLEIVISLL